MKLDNLYSIILNEAPKKKENEILQALQEHQKNHGSLVELKGLLEFGGSFNPYEAFSNIQLYKIHKNPSPQKASDNTNIPFDKTDQGRAVVHNVLYFKNPQTNDIYKIGFQAFEKIANAFHMPQKESITYLAQKNPAKEKKKLEDIATHEFAKTMQEIRKGDKKPSDVQSLRERREVAQLLDLDEEKTKALTYLNDVILQKCVSPDNYVLLDQEQGNWFTQQKKERRLPERLQEYLKDITDTNTLLPPQEHIFKKNALRAYASLHAPIHTNIIISDYISDFKEVQKLPDSNTFKKKLQKKSLLGIQDLLRSTTTTLANAARVIGAFDIEGFRIHQAQNYLKQSNSFSQDYKKAIETFEDLFIKDNRWLHSSQSVPLKYIAHSKKAPLLTMTKRKELATIMNYFRRSFASKTSKEHFSSASAQENREELDTLIVAYRKYESSNEKLRPLSKEELQKLKEGYGFLRTPQFFPKEKFSSFFSMSSHEYIQRLTFLQKKELENPYYIINKRLQREFKKKLISQDTIKTLQEQQNYSSSIDAKVQELESTSSKQIIEYQQVTTSLQQAPYIANAPIPLWFGKKPPFIVPRRVFPLKEYQQILNEVTKAKQDFGEKGMKAFKQLLPVLQHQGKRKNYKIITGELSSTGEFSANRSPIDFLINKIGVRRSFETKYIPYDNIPTLIDEMNLYEPLTQQRKEQALALTDFRYKKQRQQANITYHSPQTWGAFKNAIPGDLISTSLSLQIQKAYRRGFDS